MCEPTNQSTLGLQEGGGALKRRELKQSELQDVFGVLKRAAVRLRTAWSSEHHVRTQTGNQPDSSSCVLILKPSCWFKHAAEHQMWVHPPLKIVPHIETSYRKSDSRAGLGLIGNIREDDLSCRNNVTPPPPPPLPPLLLLLHCSPSCHPPSLPLSPPTTLPLSLSLGMFTGSICFFFFFFFSSLRSAKLKGDSINFSAWLPRPRRGGFAFLSRSLADAR